jgi:hypothetical protein
MGGLYAFADSLLNAGREEVADASPSSSIFTSSSSASRSSNNNKAGGAPSLLDSATATPKKGPTSFPYFDPESTSASSPSVSAPTLFLLDDCLKKMDGVRNRAKEVREGAIDKNSSSARLASTAALLPYS